METKEKKSSLGLALLLSFCVALAGATIWGLLYYFELLASIVAYFTIIGMFFVYRHFYKKQNALLYIWSIGWCIILNILACYIALNIMIIEIYGCTFGEATQILVEILDAELVGALIKDAVLTVAFTVAGAVSYIIYFKRKQKAQNEQNRNVVPNAYMQQNNVAAEQQNVNVEEKTTEEKKN